MIAAAPVLVALSIAAVVAPAAAAQGAPDARRSGLAGVVTDFDDRRLTGATVVVEDDSSLALSDRRGEFRLRGLAAGPRRFIVRRVGYQPAFFELDLAPDSVVTVHVRLRQNAVSLGTMEIEGRIRSLPLFRQGFYERAARHPTGWFFPPDEILRRRISTVAAVLGDVPGLTLQRRGGAVYASGRATGMGPCPFNVWVDGALAARGLNDLDLLAPGPLIRAVEVYPSASGVPPRFMRNDSHCGALVIWTKGVVRELF